MATQGTDYFALFMMNNQDRITRSLTQARRELDYAKAEEAYQRQYLMEQIASERKALAKIRTTRVTFSKGGGGKSDKNPIPALNALKGAGLAQEQIATARLKAETGVRKDYDISGATFMEGYTKEKNRALTTTQGAGDYGVRFLGEVVKNMTPDLTGLSLRQKNQALAVMARDLSRVTSETQEEAFETIAAKANISTEGMYPPQALEQGKAWDIAQSRASIQGGPAVEEAKEGIQAWLREGSTGRGAGPGRSSAPYLREQATAAEKRIGELEDELEALALDPVRMEDIRTRAGEIHAPYMRKKKQKEIEYAKTLRAMSLKGWQKNFAAAGVLGGQYADQIHGGEDYRTGTVGQSFGTNLFSQIEKKEMTLPEAMNKISSSAMDAEEQKKAVAVLVAQGILGSRRETGPPVRGEKELKESIEEVRKQSEEGWMWDEPTAAPKKGRKSKAPAEQELEDLALERSTGARPDISTEDILGGPPVIGTSERDPYEVVLPPTSDRPDLGFEKENVRGQDFMYPPTSSPRLDPRAGLETVYDESSGGGPIQRKRRSQGVSSPLYSESDRSRVTKSELESISDLEAKFAAPISPVYAPEPKTSNPQEIMDNDIINQYERAGYLGLLDSLKEERLSPREKLAIKLMPPEHWLAFARKLYPDHNEAEEPSLLLLQQAYGD